MRIYFHAVLLILNLGLVRVAGYAQCFEIESILVDACVPGSGCNNAGAPACNCEGKNEMVFFKVGSQPLNANNLTVTWPNNNFLGICQDGTTAANITALNATILNCGLLREPAGGILPAFSRVLLISSTDMCLTANSFAGLQDTVYVIFQCAGNFNGHFANFGTGLRTLNMSFSPPGACTDQVTYDRSLLTMQNGQQGGENGASVVFAPNGTASYINQGCVAPFPPLAANITSSPFNVCQGQTINLSAQIGGSFSGYQWSGGSGVFQSPFSLNTSYLVGNNDVGTFYLFFTAFTCNDTLIDSVQVIVNPISNFFISPNGTTSICPGETINLTGPQNTIINWSTGQAANGIIVNAPGTYIGTVTNACGTYSDTLVVLPGMAPDVELTATPPVLCSGNSSLLVASGCDNYTWSNGSTATQITAILPGTYWVACSNGCGKDTAFVVLKAGSAQASANASPTIGPYPLEVKFTAQGSNVNDYKWILGPGDTLYGQFPSFTFDSMGVYTVVLQVTSPLGCISYDTLEIKVLFPEDYELNVPNVFSPNGDGINDVFFLDSKGIKSIEIQVYNRWGQTVYTWKDQYQGWDGNTHDGQPCTEGVYYITIVADDYKSNHYDYAGFLHLIRGN